ncbi:MAG TPA: bestrophin family ion channel [Alphaproteobacteria bacterium]|jgi:putative membrane protein
MHVGKSYRLSEFVVWTRREIYALLVMAVVPVALYQLAGWKWLAIPWTVVAVIGTATAFIVGFKNTQTYNRTIEAQQVWTSILSASRAWGVMCRDFLKDGATSRELVYRHLAWATALRYQLRRARPWEFASGSANAEYQKAWYSVPEKESPLKAAIEPYVTADELAYALATRNKPTRLLGLQSAAVKRLYERGDIPINFFLEMEKAIKEFFDQQGRSERIKNFPYPRQYAVVSTIFVRSFCLLLPFGMLKEFDALNLVAPAWMQGHMVWWVVPFSAAISWMYTSLMQVGDSTENPFEGNANDVPMAQICRIMEIELRDLLGETGLPPLLEPKNGIIL